MFNAGDRIEYINNVQRIFDVYDLTTLQKTGAKCGIAQGLVGTCNTPAGVSCHFELDSSPGHGLVNMPEHWFRLVQINFMTGLPMTPKTMPDYIETPSKKPAQKDNGVCVCTIQRLMSDGCNCGATTRYAPPKRMF